MRYILLAGLLFFTGISMGQSPGAITTIDFVKIKNNHLSETIFYYENNWKIHRELALGKGYIKSYWLLKAIPDTAADFDLILLTEYADSAQYKIREENFQKIIKTTRPDGPVMLNALKPNEFRQNLFSREAHTIFAGGSDHK